MTRVSGEFGNTMQAEAFSGVSTDVIFSSSRFPNYKIGANNQIMEPKEDPKVFTMNEVVARETALLLDQQNRLLVRDLANKFEKGLAAAAKLSEEAVTVQAKSQLAKAAKTRRSNSSLVCLLMVIFEIVILIVIIVLVV